jgi:predicted metalloprotease
VIAHEVGHHVQRLTGARQPNSNQASVRLGIARPTANGGRLGTYDAGASQSS